MVQRNLSMAVIIAFAAITTIATISTTLTTQAVPACENAQSNGVLADKNKHCVSNDDGGDGSGTGGEAGDGTIGGDDSG